MKKNIRLAVFFTTAVSALTLSACGPQQQNETHQTDVQQEHSPGSEVSGPVFDDQQLTVVYQRYIQLKDALVDSDADKAKSEAAGLRAELDKTARGEKAAAHAAGIAETTDIGAQRTAFSELSNAMTALVKASELTAGGVYLAFCPMANNDAGAYWLASEQEIRNPYFGEKMMKCGTVKENIQ